MEMASAFTLNVRLDNIAIITIDVPGEKMNTLKAEFASQVRAIIKQLRENKELRGVVFVSAKPDNFIAGADINMIGNCKTAQEAEVLARQGQQLMAEIHALPIPVIAAIHGACPAAGWSWRWRATVVFVLTILKRCSVCLKYNLDCYPVQEVPSVYRA